MEDTMSTTMDTSNSHALYLGSDLIGRFRRWRLERRTVAALNALSDFELKDIGVARCGIGGTAMELLWMAGG